MNREIVIDPVTRIEGHSKITISLYGGKKRGLLENSRNLCKTDRLAKVSFTGQNGAVQNGNLKIGTGCGGKK